MRLLKGILSVHAGRILLLRNMHLVRKIIDRGVKKKIIKVYWKRSARSFSEKNVRRY
jgi:hypothetical protein